jgi:hypothetical protein
MPFQTYSPGGSKLQGLVQYLLDFGFQDFILPTILIFAVIFAILQQIKIFQAPKMEWKAQVKKWEVVKDQQGNVIMTGNKRINSVLAIVISLLVVIPHAAGFYDPSYDPVILISTFLPETSIVLVALFVVMLLLGLAGAGMPSAMQLFIAAIGAGILVLVFAMNMFPAFLPTLDFLRDPAIQALIVVMLTMGLVGYWVMKPEGGEELPTTLKRWVFEKKP